MKENTTTESPEKEIVIITENMFDAMVMGEPICVNGVWIAIPDNSELKFIDIIEQKLVKEWGLDVE